MRHGNRWARLLAAVCAMALFLSVISPALAAKYPYDTISMDDVNMRSRANTTSTILKKIQKGDTVTILGVTGSFYRVEFDGKTGYAMKKYIDGTDPSPDPSPNPALSMQAPPAISEYPYDTTVIDYVKLRKVAQTEGEVILTIPAGSVVTVYDRTSLADEDEIIARIADAEVVLTNKTPISRRTIDACPSMRFIAMLATGYNVVDIACAKEKGIPVSNVPVYGTHSVSQFAIALLLEICHHIGYHNDTVKSGKWEQCPDWCYWDYPLIELAGKTYGLLGCGNIGIHTAAIASALGMHVIAYDMRQRDEALQLGVEYVSLDELFARSDVLGLQMPLFPFNTGIINRENIAKMKDGVIIINNSRGQMVVEQDLADALNSGKVAAAGLDVVSTEPIRGDNPLLKAKNCIITPHISWAPRESRQRIMDCTVDNVRAYLDGEPINVVNP